MNSGHARARLVQVGAAFAAAALIAGCGNNYRPVVTPVTPRGPAQQPESFAVVVSAPSPTAAGIATIIDYSGDSIMAYAPIGPGPSTFTIDALGANGYTVNSDHTLSNFPIVTTLQAKNVTYTTLASTANLVNLFAPSSGMWAADLNNANGNTTGLNIADVFTSSPQTLLLSVPVASTPVAVVGPGSSGQRNYVLSQNFSDLTTAGVACNTSPTTAPAGVATAIETANDFPDVPITVGKCPVYAVESSDARRFFVLNRGDDTVTVINSQFNTLDQCSGVVNQNGQPVTCHPVLPLSTNAVAATGVTPPNPDWATGMTATAGPVYAEYNAALSLLVVANYDGGTISIIDVSLDQYGNDSSTFGTTYTVKVGNNPAAVTVLYDGSRAYAANQSDGTVSVVNLSSHVVQNTLTVVGHPRTVVSTQNSEYSKVYVASPDSPYLTILSTTPTETDIVDTTVLVQGNVVDVRATTQSGSSGNAISYSRSPGYGEPCNLPPPSGGYPAGYTLKQCQTLPTAP